MRACDCSVEKRLGHSVPVTAGFKNIQYMFSKEVTKFVCGLPSPIQCKCLLVNQQKKLLLGTEISEVTVVLGMD